MNASARLFLVRNEQRAPIQIQLEFGACTPLTEHERTFLQRFLGCHPEAQIILDELAGQVRQRGRGPGGIRSPRALAALLVREARAHGTESWYHWQDEAELRQRQGSTREQPQPAPLPSARPETIAAARIEANRIKERHAARRLQLLQGGKK